MVKIFGVLDWQYIFVPFIAIFVFMLFFSFRVGIKWVLNKFLDICGKLLNKMFK